MNRPYGRPVIIQLKNYVLNVQLYGVDSDVILTSSLVATQAAISEKK